MSKQAKILATKLRKLEEKFDIIEKDKENLHDEIHSLRKQLEEKLKEYEQLESLSIDIEYELFDMEFKDEYL
jgi:predicted  nucleic acid-binding Zn-ribbon protein